MGRLGASLELASAGSGGFVGEDRDAYNQAFVDAKGNYRSAAKLREGFGQSRLKSSEQIFTKQSVADQIVGNLAKDKSSEEASVSQRADQGLLNAPELLQVRWQVDQVDAVVARVTAWANAHQGFITLTAPNHLSVLLPTIEMNSFLQEFSGGTGALFMANPFTTWVTISIELLPPQ